MYVQGRVKNESGFITYQPVQQCVTSAKCVISHHNHPFFQCTLCSSSQAFLFHLRRKFPVVLEATYALRSKLHHHWQIIFPVWVHFVVQTCDNLMDYMKVWETI